MSAFHDERYATAPERAAVGDNASADEWPAALDRDMHDPHRPIIIDRRCRPLPGDPARGPTRPRGGSA